MLIVAGNFGTEAALSMALDGHKVTVLSPEPDMIDWNHMDSYNVADQMNLYRNASNFKYFLKATVKGITNGNAP
jgi:hypothetical protein